CLVCCSWLLQPRRLASSSRLVITSVRVLLWFRSPVSYFSFFFNDPPTTEIYTLSLHDALPISGRRARRHLRRHRARSRPPRQPRSEEHTSELQSRVDLVCRLLLEKKNIYLRERMTQDRHAEYRRTSRPDGRLSATRLCGPQMRL